MSLTGELVEALRRLRPVTEPVIDKWIRALSDAEVDELVLLAERPRPFTLETFERLEWLQRRAQRRHELGLPGLWWARIVDDPVDPWTKHAFGFVACVLEHAYSLLPLSGCRCVEEFLDGDETLEPGVDVRDFLRKRAHPFVPNLRRVVPVVAAEPVVAPVGPWESAPRPVVRPAMLVARRRVSAASVDAALAPYGLTPYDARTGQRS